MSGKQKVLNTSLIYAALATIGGVLGNFYIAPKFGISENAEAVVGDIVVVGLFGFLTTFAFFFVVFALLSRTKSRTEKN